MLDPLGSGFPTIFFFPRSGLVYPKLALGGEIFPEGETPFLGDLLYLNGGCKKRRTLCGKRPLLVAQILGGKKRRASN